MEIVNEKGSTVREVLLSTARKNIDKFNEMTRLGKDDLNEFKVKLDHLKYVNGNKKCSTKQKGKALEDIVSYLIEKTCIFSVYRNISTSFNEIDLVITLNDMGHWITNNLGIDENIIGIDLAFFLAECKNYNKKIGVTWVGKFNTLLRTTGSCKVGIIFSYYGLAGKEKSWNSANGLIKLLYMLEKQDRRFIIDFNITDFEAVLSGASFFEIIKNKKKALMVGTDIKQFFKHPNSELVKEALNVLGD